MTGRFNRIRPFKANTSAEKSAAALVTNALILIRVDAHITSVLIYVHKNLLLGPTGIVRDDVSVQIEL